MLCGQLCGDLRHMPALETRAFQFDLRGLTAAVTAGYRRGAIRRITHHFSQAHLALERIRQSDDHHSEMQEYGVKSEDGRFLSAMLCGRGGKDGSYFANQRALHPEAARLIEKIFHLRCHVTETCAR